VWFDQATKERQRIEEVIDFDNNDTKDIQNTGSTANDTDRKEMPDSDNQGTDGLRNVRWSVEQSEPEPEPDWSAGPTEQQKDIEIYAQSLAQQYRVALNNASFVDPDYPATSPGSSVDNDPYPFAGGPPRPGQPPGSPYGNHALLDYQIQHMLLEMQNTKRLLWQRMEMERKRLAENTEEGRPRGALFEPDVPDDMFSGYTQAGHNVQPSELEGLAESRS
jgi:hypothetical protein